MGSRVTERFSAAVDRTLRARSGRQIGFAIFGDPEARFSVFYFHGFGSSRLEARLGHATALQRNVRLVALDRPGFGLTDPLSEPAIRHVADDVASVADALGIGRFALLGVSTGGPYALATAARLTERVTGVGLISSPAPYRASGGARDMDLRARLILIWLPRFAPFALGPIYERLSRMSDRDPQSLLRMVAALLPSSERRAFTSPEIAEVFMDASYEAFRSGTAGAIAEHRLLARDWDFDVSAVRAPVWLWHGEADSTSPPAMARWLAASLPKCRAQFVPSRGGVIAPDVLPSALARLVESAA
jgi:pimeloyl-ACP methyl ester carboxylesterase